MFERVVIGLNPCECVWVVERVICRYEIVERWYTIWADGKNAAEWAEEMQTIVGTKLAERRCSCIIV